MKVTIEVPDDHVYGVLVDSGPAIAYWCRSRMIGREDVWFVTCHDEPAGIEHTYSWSSIHEALAKMATLVPQQFAALVAGKYDRTTADVLIQIATFGEVRYG
jgi:hypothetical protein